MLAGLWEEVGYTRVTERSDQKPALVKLKEAVKRELSLDMNCEETPMGEST